MQTTLENVDLSKPLKSLDGRINPYKIKLKTVCLFKGGVIFSKTLI